MVALILTNMLRVYHQAFLNQIFCFSGVDLLGKHPTISNYHAIGHIEKKNKDSNKHQNYKSAFEKRRQDQRVQHF